MVVMNFDSGVRWWWFVSAYKPRELLGCERVGCCSTAADGGGADNGIGDEGARAIGEGLQHCSSLQTLRLAGELTNIDLFLFWLL